MNILTRKAGQAIASALLLCLMVFVGADTASAQFKKWNPNPNPPNFHQNGLGLPGSYNNCCDFNSYDNSTLLDDSLLDGILGDPSTILRPPVRKKQYQFELNSRLLYKFREERYENCLERMERQYPYRSWSEIKAACAPLKGYMYLR